MDSGRLETVPQGPVHLDTVRALHQTVVSLRAALETSKNELKELKDKYQQQSQSSDCSDIIEKLTLENHILRRKIINTGFQLQDTECNVNTQNIKLEVTYSPDQQTADKFTEESSDDDLVVATDCSQAHETILVDSSEQEQEVILSITEDRNNNDIETAASDGTECTPQLDECDSEVIPSEKEPKSNSRHSSYKTKFELLSKFDVRIKVKTLQDGVITSSTTSESESTIGEKTQKSPEKDSRQSFHFEEDRENFKHTNKRSEEIEVKTHSSEVFKMAVPSETEAKGNNDKFNVQVRITSEENVVVQELGNKSRRLENTNLDIDDLSLRSLSEGDNSVFSESRTSSVDRPGMESSMMQDKVYDQDNASGNESEEVDDIELIFTTDESKDMSNLQEDLVPIKESDWSPSPNSTAHSTPVLVKFQTLDSEFQSAGETRDNTGTNNPVTIIDPLKVKRISLPSDKEARHDMKQVAFSSKSLDLPGRPGILKASDYKLESMSRRSTNTSTRLDSTDSLTCDYTRGFSFDNTKSSSYDLGSSMDILNRESVDNFYKNAHLGHRFSVFAETDISKCGVSEDDLASANMNNRRNTCPNPFQYRPLPQRGFSRNPGMFKATLTPTVGLTRPILRGDNYSTRRENGAQTEVSALPNRWSSDGYLAHKAGLGMVPTLPSRGPAVTSGRRLTVADVRTSVSARRTDDARRVLLSDIGFTSMVPELSRSADPLWARGSCACCAAHADARAAPRLASRGPSYRSPCLNIDRSSEWMAHGTSFKDGRVWRASLPDVRGDDTDDLLDEADVFLRRSIDNLRSTSIDAEAEMGKLSQPYIPAEPRHLRLGHAVKVITPQGRIAVGRVRYVGLAGASAADSCIMVGAIFPLATHPGMPLNDGTYRERRYFHAPPHHTALFVPFSKVVMAWAN